VLFVALGDFGSGDEYQRQVARSIETINPEWFVALGDNVYSQAGYQALVGDYYGQFFTESKFLPATGNHDYLEGISNYDDFFATSEQTRYYKASVASDVEVFVLDSQAALDSAESMNRQKDWLTDQVTGSTAKYKFVVIHHPPFSSGAKHGPTKEFQWDFEALEVTAALSGHEHLYERKTINDVMYLVSGAGGKTLYSCKESLPADEVCIDKYFGALYFTRVGDALLGEFRSSTGEILDSFTLF
jgi:tartrate-resistant acid phosphatase type 5